MARPLFLFSRQHTRGTLSSATNQAGLRLNGAVPAAQNTGFLSLVPAGTPSAAVNHRLAVVAGGDIGTGTFKVSTDGGTNYKGHATIWGDAEGGAAGTRKTIFSTTGSLTLLPSKAVPVDTDGDGVPDRAVVAYHDGSANVDLYYTTTLVRDSSAAQSWSSLVGNAASNYGTRPALINRDGVLYLFTSSLTYDVIVSKSTDYGATWTVLSAPTITGDGTGFDAFLLASGKFCLVYSYNTGGTYYIYCRTSQDGVTWSAAKQIDSSATVQDHPCIVQLQNGTSVCYWFRSGTGIVAKSNPAADPSTGTWSSHTIWTTASTEDQPTACVASDGSVFVAVYDTTAEKIVYSRAAADGTGYTAVADISGGTGANTSDHPQLSCIGGTVWCVFRRVDDDDIVVSFTRYWTTFSSNAATLGTDPFITPGPVWYQWGGSDGVSSDYWDIDSVYDFSAANMYQMLPQRPTRATGDGADWNAVFYAGANKGFRFNTVAIWANVEHAHYQINASDSWGSPSKNYTLDLTEFGPVAFTSIVSGHLYYSGGSWVPDEHRGKILKFDTSGNCYTIARNTELHIDVEADISAETGNFRIINPKYVFTSVSGYDASYSAYHRLLIESQQTVENYYEVKALVAAWACSYGKEAEVVRSFSQAQDSLTTPGGRIVRNARGEQRGEFTVALFRLTAAEYKQLRSVLEENDWGLVPFGFVPNSTNVREWYPVYLAGPVEFTPGRVVLRLIEAV